MFSFFLVFLHGPSWINFLAHYAEMALEKN